MRKIVYPLFKNCAPLSQAVKDPSGSYKLEIDIKNALHYAYIGTHGTPPQISSNPYFEVYQDLIDNSNELRFIPPGIAVDADSRKGISAFLGRAFAMGVLNEYYGYNWFASISNLKKSPENGWSAVTKNTGNSPDWLVGNTLSFAIAEAKGTHSHIDINSRKVSEWRTQVNNIIINKNGNSRSLKTWIIATRFVLSTQKRVKPEMLIEDPPLDGTAISDNDFRSLALWISTSHTIRNLERLQLYNLILRIKEPKFEKSKVLVWQCIHPRFEHLRFIGNPIGISDFNVFQIFNWEDILFHFNERRLLHGMQFLCQHFHKGFFDGLEFGILSSIIRSEIPNPIKNQEYNTEQYPYISILADGSFIAPMSLMRPVDVKTL